MLEQTMMLFIFLLAVICVSGMAVIYWRYLEKKRAKEYPVGISMKTELAMESFWKTMSASKNLKQEMLKEELEHVPLNEEE